MICANYDGSEIGFIGEYIVRSDKRGAGVGQRLWQYGMNYLRNVRHCKNIALAGTTCMSHFTVNNTYTISDRSMHLKYRDRAGFIHIPKFIILELILHQPNVQQLQLTTTNGVIKEPNNVRMICF
jgi:hypothetical protein